MLKHAERPSDRISKSSAVFSQLQPLVAYDAETRFFCFSLLSRKRNTVVDFWDYLADWQERYTMARRNYGVDFVNIRLSPDDKKKFDAWAQQTLPDLADHLLALVSNDYKVSLNLDAQNDCYIVAFTGNSDNRKNKGLCMTSRSGDLIEAILIGLYKHEVLCENGEWGEPEQRDNSWG